jgi:hypothetical protein
VARRIKDQFAPAYLTLTSIIQGVALAALVARVEATYAAFGTADWLLTVATFVAFLAVWHEYLMQALAYVWLPSLLDSLVPFAFLAGEFFMAHFVSHGLRGWLLALGLVMLVGALAQIVTGMQAYPYAENRAIARLLKPHSRFRAALDGTIVLLCAGAWALYDALQLGREQTLFALVALAAVCAFVGTSVPLWHRLRRYALGESGSAEQTEAKE